MISFERKFSLLVEKDIKAPIEEAPPTEPEAFKNQLEPETDPYSFDVQPNPELNYHAKRKSEQLKTLHGWIKEIEQMVAKLNGLKADSIQGQLNSAESNTVFSDIARSETKKISRIAQDLSGFAESLKGHLMSADTSV